MAGEPVATLYSISNLIKRCRNAHLVDVVGIDLIPDLTNDPGDTPDAANLDNWDSSEAESILDAVEDYSSDKPLHQILLVSAGANQQKYFLDELVTGWDNKDWKIERIQYPIDGQLKENWFENQDYRQTRDPATGRPILQFQERTLTGSFAIHYFRPHVFEPGLDQMSIPRDHWEVVAKKAAAKVLRKAAAICASFGDRVAGFDNKDLSGVMQRYETKAEKYDAEYDKIIGQEEPDASPTWITWPGSSPTGYRDFHPPNLY